jgi:hypothetical protein
VTYAFGLRFTGTNIPASFPKKKLWGELFEKTAKFRQEPAKI